MVRQMDQGWGPHLEGTDERKELGLHDNCSLFVGAQRVQMIVIQAEGKAAPKPPYGIEQKTPNATLPAGALGLIASVSEDMPRGYKLAMDGARLAVRKHPAETPKGLHAFFRQVWRRLAVGILSDSA